MSIVIGMSGRARHGKTEACQAIVRAAIELGLSAGLYDIGSIIREYCITTGQLPNIKREDMSKEQLEILINVGKEKRAVDPQYWIGQVMAKIAKDDLDVALCPNCRFETEAIALRNVGGYLVRLKRLNDDGSTFISDDRPPNDISETALEFWPADFYIVTKGAQLPWLRQQAVGLFQHLLSKEAYLDASSNR